MSFAANKLWDLLPAHLRTRDAELANPNGPDTEGRWKPGPLRQLVEVIADQIAVLEEHLEQLYDNHFVETAAPWVLPYLGDLLGIRGLPATAMAQSPRAEVGHTIAYRRRKGTAPMLEQLAHDVTGWPARAVEFFERLAATQQLNHLRLNCRSFAGLRDAENLEFVGTPFEPLTRTVEVRRIEPGRGKWNIPNLGLFLWRLRAYPHSGSPLAPVDQLRVGDPLAARRFRLHPLGFDAPLFSQPETEDKITHLAEPKNVPLRITRRMLADGAGRFEPTAELYGSGKSVSLEDFDGSAYLPIPPERVIVCDLSDATDAANNPVWNHENKATGDRVALDPVLSRVILGTAPADSRRPPRATFHLGFSFELGGGEYGRARTFAAETPTIAHVPGDRATLTAALNDLGQGGGAIEITDSGRYVEMVPDVVANSVTKELRAADQRCPIVLIRHDGGRPWTISGDANGTVALTGLWLVGALPETSMAVSGQLGKFAMRHCTLAPGCRVETAASGATHVVRVHQNDPYPCLAIDASRVHVTIENCVLPPLRVGADSVRVRLRNCIIDAGRQDRFALSNLKADGPAGSWRLENCTVIGKVALDVLELASNCIFLGESVLVRRRQEGCVRFSWVPSDPQTRTPRRHRCLSGAGPAEVRPHFTSLQFGNPAYAQVSRHCPEAVRAGADDGAEMGAFHDVFQPQREAHLRARLAENLCFGLEAGVFYES